MSNEARKLVRRSDPPESRAGAEYIAAKDRLSISQAEALDAVTEWPGLTATELAQRAGTYDSRKIGRRLHELEEKGRIRRESGTDWLTRRAAARWFPTEKGE